MSIVILWVMLWNKNNAKACIWWNLYENKSTHLYIKTYFDRLTFLKILPPLTSLLPAGFLTLGSFYLTLPLSFPPRLSVSLTAYLCPLSLMIPGIGWNTTAGQKFCITALLFPLNNWWRSFFWSNITNQMSGNTYFPPSHFGLIFPIFFHFST